jgi:cysteine desulfurase
MRAARIYADHAATTPARPEVVAAMLEHFDENGFNPSSLHAEGRRAKAALDGARERVARALGAAPREIVFTGGGSEADNLALLGVARARRSQGRHVVSAVTEHHAVLHALDVLEAEGFEIELLPVDGAGRVDPAAFVAALRDDTILASVMLANNELGTLQPVPQLARAARARGIVFHTDAVQAPGRVPVDVRALGVDLLSLSGHKFYGPKGVGVLYVRAGTALAPLAVGGSQEAGLRAGTENVAGIVGLATGLELAVQELPAESERLAALRERFERGLRARIPEARFNAAEAERLPNFSSVAVPGLDAPSWLIRLDLAGAAVSAGSACAAGATEPSHVIAALGRERWVEESTLRFSFGRLTGKQEVEALLDMLPDTIEAARVGVPNLGTTKRGSVSSLSEDNS